MLLEHPHSIAAAEAALGDELASVGVGELDVGVLRGANRDATVLLATWASTTSGSTMAAGRTEFASIADTRPVPYGRAGSE